jgi:hypothetical protein
LFVRQRLENISVHTKSTNRFNCSYIRLLGRLSFYKENKEGTNKQAYSNTTSQAYNNPQAGILVFHRTRY